MRNNLSLLALCLWCLLALPTTRAWSGNRQKANFNSGWLLALGDIHGAEATDYDDHAWQRVTLPHAWNEAEAFRVPIQADGLAQQGLSSCNL